MRIAYISYEYPPDSSNGGIATYVAQAARMMASLGHDVEVFASSPTRNTSVVVNGIREHWVRETDRLHFGIVVAHVFAARHAEQPFDVVEGPEYFADARRVRKLVPDVPLVVKLHTPTMLINQLCAPSPLRAYAKLLKSLAGQLVRSIRSGKMPESVALVPKWKTDSLELDKLERNHAKEATLVAPPCEDLCKYARDLWKIEPDRVMLAPHPYEAKADFLNIEHLDGELIVGLIGRVERRKGVETLTQAIPLVLKEFPNVKFRFIGAIGQNPDTGESYDVWIKRTLGGLAKNVEFSGKVPLEKMAGAYADLSVATFPSIWENFPNVCLEAMSAGLPVVATSSGGMVEMLDHGKCGIVVPPQDPASLAKGIASLLASKEERARLGKLARERVVSSYNHQTIGRMMENVFTTAIRMHQSGKSPKA